MAKAESDRDDLISINEKKFVCDYIKNQKRIDNRDLYEFRDIKIGFGSNFGQVYAELGETKTFSNISCEVVPPSPKNPTKGFFKLNTSFSPIASPAFSNLRYNSHLVEMSRIIEKNFRVLKVVNTKTLCLIPGKKVWSIRLDIHVLDDNGNLIDCCNIGAITALLHFRMPVYNIVEDQVVYKPEKDDQIPITIYQIPISVSFAVFSPDIIIIDPNWKEEKCLDAKIIVTLNNQNEICAFQKSGGLSLSPIKLLEVTKIAKLKSTEIINAIFGAIGIDGKKLKC